MTAAVEAFRRHGDLSFLPVVDALDQPIGIVRERRLKALLYTQYGWHLLNNSHYRRQVRELVEPCPIVDARRAVEDVVASYAADAGDEGLLVVRDMTYVGFLTSRSLLGLVAEQELAAARDQNPLTKLPGNTRIYAYVSRALADGGAAYTLCYFDFDNFKPFNDSFGFRQGDRAIILFADLMRGMLPPDGSFIGHVGGDDFFAGFHGGAVDQAADLVRRVTTKFATDVQSFYDATSRALGHIEGKDRDGRPRRFPLMTVSAVLVPLPPGRQGGNLDEIAEAIAIGKKLAKHDPARVATVDLKLQTH
jgi:diguanylate cyclase (GGDEF)-like protein